MSRVLRALLNSLGLVPSLHPVARGALRALADGRELSGYEICKIPAAAWPLAREGVGFGAIYPRLRLLESRGLVSGRWVDPSPGRRRRHHVYVITPRGRRALEREMRG